jgi:hypothetical protein
MSKGRKIGGWVITGLLAALFLFSAAMKFVGAEQVIEGFEKYGLADMRLIIGAGEVASALLYFIPLTASLGVLLLSAYMGGAICTHMANGEPYIFQSILLVVIWLGYYLRYPEMLVSFTKGRTPAPSESSE